MPLECAAVQDVKRRHTCREIENELRKAARSQSQMWSLEIRLLVHNTTGHSEPVLSPNCIQQRLLFPLVKRVNFSLIRNLLKCHFLPISWTSTCIHTQCSIRELSLLPAGVWNTGMTQNVFSLKRENQKASKGLQCSQQNQQLKNIYFYN